MWLSFFLQEADLFFMGSSASAKRANSFYIGFLLVIDVFSDFIWTYPIKQDQIIFDNGARQDCCGKLIFFFFVWFQRQRLWASLIWPCFNDAPLRASLIKGHRVHTGCVQRFSRIHKAKTNNACHWCWRFFYFFRTFNSPLIALHKDTWIVPDTCSSFQTWVDGDNIIPRVCEKKNNDIPYAERQMENRFFIKIYIFRRICLRTV